MLGDGAAAAEEASDFGGGYQHLDHPMCGGEWECGKRCGFDIISPKTDE